MKFILCMMFVIPFVLQSAILKGRVSDLETDDPLFGAEIWLKAINAVAVTDNSGFFELDSIPVGHYFVRTRYVGYNTSEDTITISASDEILVLIIRLQSYSISCKKLQSQLLTPDEMTKINVYQDSLRTIGREKELLTIFIDSLFCNTEYAYKGELKAKMSMRNNSNMPLFVFQNYPCMARLDALILNSKADKVKKRSIFIDHVGDKCLYDSSDIIEILPHNTIQYPLTFVWLHNCRNLSADKYSVRIIYSYRKPELFSVIWGGLPDKKELLNYLKAVRGTFISENVWHLNIE